MNPRLLLIPALAVLAVVCIPALAQAPAAADATAAAAALPSVPPHTCVAPEYPGRTVSNSRIVAFNKDYKTYGDCIKKYVDVNRSWANAVVEANNKAIDEYNKYTEKLRQAIEAAKE